MGGSGERNVAEDETGSTPGGGAKLANLGVDPDHSGVTQSHIDVRTSIDEARRRRSVELRLEGDGRRSIDGIVIPHHDYFREAESCDEEAEMNNVNLPKSGSVDSFGQPVEQCDHERGAVKVESQTEILGQGGSAVGQMNRVRVSTEENNLIPHVPTNPAQYGLPVEGRRSSERKSGELRKSGDARSGDGRRLSGSSVCTSTESAENAKIRSLSHSTLYLGNLHPYVNDVVLRGLFAGFEGIVELKVIKDRATGLSAGYGFARFADVGNASLALEHVKDQTIFGQQIKANWALHKDKEDELGSHHHVFVGDLSPDVRDEALMAAFSHLEGCSDARVMWDHGTGRSKGYGFVSFVDKDQAERAIEVMDGAYVGTRRVRCGWAKHKTDVAVPADPNILDQTDPTNTNIYIGNLPGDISNEEARDEFSKYGTILEIKLHRKGNYGFVRYQTHTEAVNAIVALNDGQSFGGRKLKCSWGRHPMVPPSGVKAQLIMAAATSGQLAQPGMLQPVPSTFMQTAPVPNYNMMPANMNLMGMGAPGLAPSRQPSPVFSMAQMAHLDGAQAGTAQMGNIESVAESMARMGFYGNQVVMPPNPNPDVDHAMSSGFYRSGTFGQTTGSAGYGSFPDSRPHHSSGRRDRRQDTRHDAREGRRKL